jgi:cytidine deaminase
MALVDRLLRAAARVRKNGWAPYSGFRVGAAVLSGGRVFTGCNVENSSYPLSVCAERNAIAAAVAAGRTRIEAIAIVGGAERPSAPCGGCRQVLSEFGGPGLPVVYAAPAGARISTTLAALLPESFGPKDLREAAESTGRSRDRPGRPRSAPRSRGTRSTGRSRSR